MLREDWSTGYRLARTACDEMFAEAAANTGRSVAEVEYQMMLELGCFLEELNGFWPFEVDPRVPAEAEAVPRG